VTTKVINEISSYHSFLFYLTGIPTHAQECSATNVDGTTTVVSQRVLRCQK
jgi:hypothetical protein